jgi:hypothetical protein
MSTTSRNAPRASALKILKAIRFKGSEIDGWVKNNGSLKGLERRPVEGELPLFDGDGGMQTMTEIDRAIEKAWGL